MRASSLFFKIFPPPSFLLMPHSGLDVSDDAIRCISYKGFGGHRRLGRYGETDLPSGLVEGGDIKDEKDFVSRLRDFARKNDIYYVKVSIPEEKSYLFQTDVPAIEFSGIVQNIEFKLEENVPLSAQDALFYFDLIPATLSGSSLKASVSVVPRTYVEHYVSLLEQAGLAPIAFEVVPKAIARAVLSPDTRHPKLVVHVMDRKTGIYIVSNGVVNFASTVGYGVDDTDESKRNASATSLAKEITRVYSYWGSHGTGAPIGATVLVGKHSEEFEAALGHADGEEAHSIRVANVWSNAFSTDHYVPPISKADSSEYAVAAGLALDLSQEY